MMVAVPVGLGSAIYLSEYARPRVRKVLKPVLEILAGIPSVVLGFFAVTFISPELDPEALRRRQPRSTCSPPASASGILTIPLVASVSEDALRSVPLPARGLLRHGGPQDHDGRRKVVIPAAVSGLVAGLHLAVSRAIGETMVVFIAAGGSGQPAPSRPIHSTRASP